MNDFVFICVANKKEESCLNGRLKGKRKEANGRRIFSDIFLSEFEANSVHTLLAFLNVNLLRFLFYLIYCNS